VSVETQNLHKLTCTLSVLKQLFAPGVVTTIVSHHNAQST
jgi:hypothetical protein